MQVIFPPYNTHYVKYNGKGNWSLYTDRGELKPNGRKYMSVDLRYYKGNKVAVTKSTLHRIIYALKMNDPSLLEYDGVLEVDHEDRNPLNNHPNNLRLVDNTKQYRNRDTTVVTDYSVYLRICKMKIAGKGNEAIAKAIGGSTITVTSYTTGKLGQDLYDKLPKDIKKSLDVVNLEDKKRKDKIKASSIKKNAILESKEDGVWSSRIKDPKTYVAMFKSKIKEELSNADVKAKFKIESVNTVQAIFAGTLYKKWLHLIPDDYIDKAKKINLKIMKMGKSYEPKYY